MKQGSRKNEANGIKVMNMTFYLFSCGVKVQQKKRKINDRYHKRV